MRHLDTIFLTILTIGVASSCTRSDRSRWPSAPSGPGAVRGLDGAYLDIIDALLPEMGQDSLTDREESQQALEKICHRAHRPGNEAARAALSKAMMRRVGPETAKPARVWLLRKIEPLGRDEVVDGLAGLLHDDEAEIRELARRALQNNPAPRAAEVLRAALVKTEDPAWQVALINALAARRDRSSVSLIVPLVQASAPHVAGAAIAALGDLGGSRATETLYALWREEDAHLSARAADALLHIADREHADGHRRRAVVIYRDAYESGTSANLRAAGLRGLAASEGEKSLPTLLAVMKNDADREMGQLAARFAQEIPGQNVTRRLAGELQYAPSEMQVLLLDLLGGRGDLEGRDPVLAMLESPMPEVRIAALRASEQLGDQSAVLPLAVAASQSTGEEREAARISLARLHGENVDRTILAGMNSAAPSVRVELIKALKARWVAESVPDLLSATREQDPSVRLAALEALAALAREADLPALVQVLVKAQGEDVQEAAENAVIETCRRIDDGERRTAPVLAALSGAPPAVTASLIRTLGRIEGEEALAAIRSARGDPDPTVRDAAVRALAQWSDPTVLRDLIAIARTSNDETHRVLALRGYVRLVRLPNDRPPAVTLELIKKAMDGGQDIETKKQALAAVGDVMHPEAAKYALSFLKDGALKAEAGAAALGIARGMCAEHYEDAVKVVEEVRAGGAAADDLLDEAREFVEDHRGHCVRWLFSGPYKVEGKKGAEHMDLSFPPEERGAQAAPWTPLPVADPKNPWQFDLNKAAKCTSCCGYVKTQVWSEEPRKARLVVGSDDGVKAWLNGQVVHRNGASRALKCGEDTVEISLMQGWNELLLKVTQGGGDWGVCCGIKAADGGNIDGLRFEAE